MDITPIHIACMLGAILFVLGAGVYVSKTVKSSEDYSVGGRSAGAIMMAGSIAGTIIGGGATVGSSQLAFSYGLSAWWFTLGSGLALILMGIFYARKMHRLGVSTIPEILERAFGEKAAMMCTVISSVALLLSIVASGLSGISFIALFFGVPSWAGAVILSAFVILYTFFGGMKSAGVSGILKMLIIFFSLFIAGFSAFSALREMENFSTVFPAMPWLSLFGEGVQATCFSLFSVLVGVLCTQSYVQCIFSAATPTKAAWGCILAAFIIIPVGLPSVAIGMYMRAFAPETEPVLVLPMYLLNHENAVLAGIALGGIILSVIGSIGGLSLAVGTMVSKDLLAKCFSVRNDRVLFYMMRTAVVCVIALSAVISLWAAGSEVLFWNYLSMAFRGGGILFPLTIAIWKPHLVSKGWAVFSMASSTAASMLTATVFPLPINSLFVGLIVSALCLLAGMLAKKI